jgi:CHASE1-domain containing sensor protein
MPFHQNIYQRAISLDMSSDAAAKAALEKKMVTTLHSPKMSEDISPNNTFYT